MTIEFTVSGIVAAPAQAIYDAWLDGEGHSAMTGSPAHGAPEAGASFDAWDGYITGTNLVLEPPRRIVQAWRTAMFKADEPDSEIEVSFEPVEGGTRLSIRHSNVPDGEEHYEAGWQSHYIEPIKRYFAAD